MRRLALFALTLAVSGCRCGSTSVSSRFGELVVVQLGTTGREVLSRDTRITLPPTFMETSEAGEVPVRNVGLEDISILSVTRLEGDESITMDEAVGLTISPSADATLPVRFSPGQAADAALPELTHRAKFSVKLTGARDGEDEVSLEFVAVAVARDCFMPSLIDFGRVPLRQAVVNPLTLANGRALAAATTFGAVEGADSTAFFIDAVSPLDVPAGGSVQVPLRFSPLEERAYEASVSFQRGPSCPAVRVRLIGEGNDQALSWSPASLDFGRLPLGVTSTKTVTLVNQTNVPLSLASAVGASIDFGVEAGAPTVLPARASITVRVSCSPQALGPLSAILTVDIGTLPPTPARIPMTCAGGGPRLRVDPSPIQFGNVPFNATGSLVTRHRVLVQNVGTAPLTPGDASNNLVLGAAGALPWFAIVPKNGNTRSEEFTVAMPAGYDNTIGLPAVAGKNFAEFEVGVAPTSAGLREADLLVYSNDSREPVARIPITATPRLPENCGLTFAPSSVDFGSTPRGAVVTRTVTFTNDLGAGTGDCLVSGIELAAGSDLSFAIIAPSAASLLVPRGQSRTLTVQAVVPGSANVGDYLRGVLRFNLGTETVPRALPVDLKVSRCLVVDPPLLDLGLVQQNCTSAAKTVTLYNVCGVPITVMGTSVPGAPFRITSAPFGNGSVLLDPSDQLHLQVAAAPTTIASFSDVLRIDTEEAGLAQSEYVALRAHADSLGLQQDAYVQGNAQVDILLVIDDSCSMLDEQMALATNFAAFMSSAAQSTANWHIGVVDTDVSHAGILERSPSNPATLTPTTPNVSTLFSDKVRLGTNGSGKEQPFATMAMAVTEPNKSGLNANFLRTDAALAVVIVTDALEQSPNSVGSYLATLRAAKNNRNELISVSVVGPFTPASSTCSTEGQVDDGRFHTLVSQTNGVQTTICTQDWATDLQSISRSVFGERRTFELSGTPRSAAGIVVTVDGVVVPASSWTFDPANNAVVFTQPPNPGAAISLDYRTACF